MRFTPHHRRFASVLAALLTAATAHAADPVAAAEPVAAEDLAIDLDVKLTLQPSNVSINRSISFDEAGKPRHRNEQLQVNFYCFYESAVPPLSYRDLKVDSVITSSGEALTIDPDQHRRNNQQIQANRQREGRPYFNLYVQVPAPTRPAETLREVRGTVTLDLPRGPQRVIRLAPASKFLGKRFRVVDVDDSIWQLDRLEPEGNEQPMVGLTHARQLQNLIQEIEFYTAQGNAIETNGGGWSGGNQEITRRFRLDLPDDAVILIKLYRKARSVEVPFVATEVPLPMPMPQGPVFDLAIATLPLEEAVPRGDGEAGPEELEAVIEGD